MPDHTDKPQPSREDWLGDLEKRFEEEGWSGLTEDDVASLEADPDACKKLFTGAHEAFTTALAVSQRRTT
jgi:hypothetical protein